MQPKVARYKLKDSFVMGRNDLKCNQEALMTLGKKLHDLRINKGYSQAYVATQMNVSRQAISKWERDETLPDLYNLKKR